MMVYILRFAHGKYSIQHTTCCELLRIALAQTRKNGLLLEKVPQQVLFVVYSSSSVGMIMEN